MVKFRIGFTIEAETMFAYISKFMPALHDLQVEEVYDKSEIERRAIEKKFASETIKIDKPRKKQITHFKHPSGRTLKDFMLEYMNNSPKYPATWGDLAKHSVSLGFHKSSVNNAVARLLKAELIQREGAGKYKLKQK